MGPLIYYIPKLRYQGKIDGSPHAAKPNTLLSFLISNKVFRANLLNNIAQANIKTRGIPLFTPTLSRWGGILG